MSDDLKIGVYEFLLKCRPERVWHDDLGDMYTMEPITEGAMEQLATDLGVELRTNETAWEAIQRYMETKVG